ncbi:MAG: hypothetical protein RLO17_26350 [Cyclobacteriaceae bacterium]
MRAAYFTPKVFAIFGLLLFAITVQAQQYSAGINTENPNVNAVLHLVAPNGDQGLLIPTLTTGQRTTMGLTATDNGMLVFDIDDGLFYYWLNPSWIALTTTDNDNQTLSIAGTNLTISSGNTVDIGVAESDPTVPATIKDGIDWTEISGIPAGFSDNTDDGIASVLTDATITGDGIGTPLSVNAGTGANQIVQLNGTGQLPAFDASNLTNLNAGALIGVLPAIDGSNLTGVTSSAITDGTTITGDGSATQLAVGTVPAAQVSGLATIATTGSFGDLTLVPVGLADGDDVGLTTVTSADIVDNEIANIDINAAANIAATKLENTVMVEGENVGLLNNDVGYMTAGTYDPNTIAGDAFDFSTHTTVTAPATGDVLTFDGTTWDAQPSTGLTLPYTQSVANAADLFYLTNTGLGGAGAFEINNITNASNALNATTNGIGAAIQASQGGTAGPGMDISISGATNTSPGILVSHSGAGSGLNISLSNATNPDAGLSVNHAGLGAAIEITTATGPPMFITGGNAGEVLTSDALGNITLQPGGIAFPFAHTEDTDPTDLFYLDQQGTLASAARFTNSTGAFTGSVVSIEGNGLSGSQGLAVTQIGGGDAGTFLVSGAGAGTAVYGSTTGTGAAGLFEISNAGNTSPVIEVINGGAGPDIRLPTGATAGYVLTSDATGNATWQVNGLTLPYADSGTDVGSLFSISNAGTGPAAFFENTGSGTAVRLGGNILFNEGAGRIIGVQQNTVGNGDNLAIAAADGVAAGPADGGILSLRSGAGTGTGGNGGNIEIIPGAGSGGGFAGGVFINGITRFGNQEGGFGGMIELEDDAGTASIGIQADPTTTSYTVTLPPAQGAGALTNDGAGTLSWSGGGAFSQDANQNLVAISTAAPTGTDNFIAGNAALGLGAGNNNIAIGEGAGASLTGGSDNFLMGFDVGGPNLINGNSNILFGSGGRNNDDTDNNVGIGQNVIMAGGSATAIGAFSSATGTNSLALGTGAVVTLPNVGVIGDHTNPIDIGIGTNTPVARLDVQVSGAGTPDVVNITNDGDARSLFIDVVNLANATPAFQLNQNGTGVGIDARITSATSTSTLIAAQHQGDAAVGSFNQANAGSAAPVIAIGKSGAGPDIQLSGVGNAFNIPGSTPGYVATVTNAAGDVSFQPAPAGGFSLDGNNNLIAISGATPPGSENFLVGVNTGNSLVAGGSQNTLIGNGAGQSITSGSANVVIGVNGGGAGLTTGSNNVVLGTSATVSENTSPHVVIGQGASAAGTTSIAIGPSASATGNNSVALGNNTSAPNPNTAIIGDVSIPGFFVGVGTTAPTAKLSVENGNATGQGMAINMVAASANPDQALLIAQNADGMGADIRITNSASASAVLSASTQGTGNVGVFDQQNVTSGGDAMFVQTLGLGSAGVFQISNATSASPALSVNTDGNNSNAISISKLGTSGTGILIDMNNAGAQGILIGGTNPASSSIDADGDVVFRANLIAPPLNHDAAAVTIIPSDTRIVKISNAGPDIDQIAPGVEGQEIILIVDAGVPGFNIITGGNLRLDNNAAHPMLPGASIHFVYIETLNQWVEISRSR